MLKSYSIENYKPFRNRERVEIAPLTLIFGHNGSGKSALTRLPLLILRALSSQAKKGEPLPLETEDAVFGRSSLDLVYGRDSTSAFCLGAELGNSHDRLKIILKIQNLFDPSTGENRAVVSNWEASGSIEETLEWERSKQSPTPYKGRGSVPFRGFWPELNEIRTAQDEWRSRVDELDKDLVYLGPFRSTIKNQYPSKTQNRIGAHGEGAPYWLRGNHDLEKRVTNWFRENLDVDISIVTEGESFRLAAQRGGASISGVELGEGTKQCLPVVTALSLMAIQGEKPRIGIFEQPELRLHNAAQGALADLFIDTINAGAGPLIVETHSELFLLRTRRRIAEGSIRPDQVAIYWVQSENETSTVQRMTVRKNGWVEGWNQGVYDETFQEVAALQRAARRHRSKQPTHYAPEYNEPEHNPDSDVSVNEKGTDQ